MSCYRIIGIVAGAFLVVAFAACSLPSTPTPFAIPTPNLTMTALFQPTETIPPSITPPAVQTATPIPASPTPVEGVATESEPTATSLVETPSAPGQRSGPSVEAAFLETTPVIDGNLSEWNLSEYSVNRVVFGAANYSGSADLAGKMMVAWDETNLFFAVWVTDDAYVQNASGDQLYRGDSLEVVLDTNLSADFNTTNLSPDDFQLGISPGSTVGEGVRAYLWLPQFLSGPRSQVEIAASETEDGYQVEMAIPWSVFDVKPMADDSFGFALSISDNDRSGENLQQSMVSNVSTRLWYDPTTWGNLTLSKP